VLLEGGCDLVLVDGCIVSGEGGGWGGGGGGWVGGGG
jgi:hypothetical protein